MITPNFWVSLTQHHSGHFNGFDGRDLKMFQNSNNALLKCRLSDPVLTSVIADIAGSRPQDKVRGGEGGGGVGVGAVHPDP